MSNHNEVATIVRESNSNNKDNSGGKSPAEGIIVIAIAVIATKGRRSLSLD